MQMTGDLKVFFIILILTESPLCIPSFTVLHLLNTEKSKGPHLCSPSVFDLIVYMLFPAYKWR